MNDKKFIEQAFECAYKEVCDLEQRIAALQYSISPVQKGKWSVGNSKYRSENEYGALYSELYDLLNESYRKVFMFGVVSCDRKLMAKAKKMAFDHYLKENSNIMSYLGFEGSYSCELEDKFRKELEWLEKSDID